ncbi:MAG: hypothetical protein ACE5JM_17540, partial [Armatimonadota bacterium]
MNRDEVLEQLAPLAGTQVRTGNGGGRVLVDSGGGGFALRPSHRARSLELAPQGVAGLLNYTGVSDTLAKRLTPATLAQVATESLHARSGNGEYTVLTQEGQVVDFAQPGRFREIRPDRVVGNIERGIPDEVEFNRVLTLPHHTVRIETMGTQERAVRVGDLVRAGTMTQFSPLGLTEAVVQAYNVRLVCTNGMTTTDVVREFRMTGGRGGPGEGDDIWQFFRRSNRDAYRAFGQVVDRYT